MRKSSRFFFDSLWKVQNNSLFPSLYIARHSIRMSWSLILKANLIPIQSNDSGFFLWHKIGFGVTKAQLYRWTVWCWSIKYDASHILKNIPSENSDLYCNISVDNSAYKHALIFEVMHYITRETLKSDTETVQHAWLVVFKKLPINKSMAANVMINITNTHTIGSKREGLA